MSNMDSVARRERIRELLIEELHETGDLEPAERVISWMTLISAHHTDSDGDELGTVYTVMSVPGPTASQMLGLMEWQRMMMQAKVTAVVLQADE